MTSNLTFSPSIFPELRDGDFKSIVAKYGSYQFERILGKSRQGFSLLIKDSAHDKRLLVMRLQSKISQRNQLNADKNSPFPIINSSCLHELQEFYNNKCASLDFVIKPILLTEAESFITSIRPFSRFNLADLITSCSLDHEAKCLIAYELTAAIIKLHHSSCWHGDLSSRKVFLSSQLQIFISDFNPSKPFCPESSHQNPYQFFKLYYCGGSAGSAGEAGSGCYLAPERLQIGQDVDFGKADLFSLGCILGEIFGEGDAFLCFEDTIALANCDNDRDYYEILKYALYSVTDEPIANLIKALCHPCPKERVLSMSDLSVFGVNTSTIKKREVMSKFSLQPCLEFLMDLRELDLNHRDFESILQIALTSSDLLLKMHIVSLLSTKLTEAALLPSLAESLDDCFGHLFFRHADKIIAGAKKLRIAHGMKSEPSKKKDDIMQLILKDNLIQEAVEVADELNLSTAELWSKLFQIYRSSGNENLVFEDIFGFHAAKAATTNPEVWNAFVKYSKLQVKLSKNIFLSRIAFSLDLAKNDIPFHVFYSSKDQTKPLHVSQIDSSQFRFRQRLMASIAFQPAGKIIGIFEDHINKIIVMYCTSNLYFWDLSALCLAARIVKGPFATATPRSDSSIKKIFLLNELIVILYSDGLLCQYRYKITASLKQPELTELNMSDNFQSPVEVSEMLCACNRILLLSKDKKSLYAVSFETQSASLVKEFDFAIADVLDCNELVLVCGENGRIELIDFIFQSAFSLKQWQLNCPVMAQLHHFSILTRESVLCLAASGTVKDGGTFTAIFNICGEPDCLFRFWHISDVVNDKNLPELILSDTNSRNVNFIPKWSSVLTTNELVMLQDNILRIVDWNCFTDKNASAILLPAGYRPTLKLRNRFGQTPEIVEKYPASQVPSPAKDGIICEIISIDHDEEYDFIVLGTGLTECVLSGILSMEGKKVLHIDRNDYYGGEGASLSLTQLFARYRPNQDVKSSYGRDRDYCVDLIPKFLMASGEFVDILSALDLSRYIDFVQIDGSFVFREGKGICKVPSTPMEAASSSLMGFFEKRRAKDFFQFCVTVDEGNPSTWAKHNLYAISMADLFKVFGLDANTINFIGHALALHSNDAYLKQPALATVQKIKLYMNSMLRFGKSPFLYPLYGLGELPQGFARLSAIYGGTYMLETPFDSFVYHEQSQRVVGVRSGDKVFKAPCVICDPSYVPDRVCLTHRVIRAICLLDHPIPSASESCQIILPQKQLHRHHDIYVSCLSSAHNVCPPGFYLAQISTIVETANPEAEIAPAVALLGGVLEKFVSISNLYEPLTDGSEDGIFISRSMDSSTHFESICEDVKSIFSRAFGRPLQVQQRPSAEEEQSLRNPSRTSTTPDISSNADIQEV